MSDGPSNNPGGFDIEMARRIDKVCRRFEADWRARRQPHIEDYLVDVSHEGRPALRAELEALERELSPSEEMCARPEVVPVATPDAQGSSLGDPSTIGRYRVIRQLGQGGFGRVYLARDDQLDRPVAIKVPIPERVAGPEDVEQYLAEARALARLDHPNIVPVHDVGRSDDGLCYVVSKYIDGSNLADRLKQARPSFRESAELAARVALALHHAHTRDVVHRDVKPANILIDTQGKPCLADFGLALKDEDFGKGARLAGTPAYMSPEQAWGEGHRVDGRSDIFSLGAVFYELLTGRRPFRGDSHQEVMDQIGTTEPRPPRQIDDTIPRELERICQKMLAKRASERYSTARDLAEDLRHFLHGDEVSGSLTIALGTVGPPPGSTQEATPTPQRPDSDGPTVKVVPKGLRSFDQHDADFFLELLPGPRDRDGLPESLRFWKTRIESTDPDATFRVGLIYGPSGCGKSSLVKAGLLPRLGKAVLPVYVEATSEETEARLLRGLHKACPDLPADRNLVDSLAALRRGRILQPSQKVLLVLDQFEQWLFARRGEENPELVPTLRQCDGEHVQAIVLVRDDFWLAASRFMRELEIDLEPNLNIALVDLFDLQHARKVLTEFGKAYVKLPESDRDRSREQDSFLSHAVTGLAQDGKVISVRLALFAEMMKGKPWTPETLRRVGGAEGVGVTFLEETFSSPQANPKHRLHQKAAQAVLNALLPESGTNIKGQMRSEHDLQGASGYADRSRDFADLTHILDNELRLITPTDPTGSDDNPASVSPGGRYYQLTHDYLVHSLRDWLTRKQRETRRGRAELRLAERSASWNAKPENRLLPSVWEWANVRLLTKKRDWTEAQRRMMRRAGRLHGVRGLGLAAAAAVLTGVGLNVRQRVIEANQATAAVGLVQQLLKVDTGYVPGVVQAIGKYRRWTDPGLRRAFSDSRVDPRSKLHASLALLEVDPSQVEFLFARLLRAAPGELAVIRNALNPHQSVLAPKLWSLLDSAQTRDEQVLPAAAALALYDTESPRWARLGGKVAQALVSVSAVDLGAWIGALRPIRGKLTAPMAALFKDKTQSESEHTQATSILVDYAADEPALLAELLLSADAPAFAKLFPVAERQAARVLPSIQAELEKKAEPTWDDPPADPSWTKPDAAMTDKVESSQGLLGDRFAFCQIMPLDEFVATAEALRSSGYRPIRFRPYADGSVVRLAGVWARDGRSWRLSSALSLKQMRQQEEKNRSEKLVPVDVAGYLAAGKDGKPGERYAAIWVENTGSDGARMFAGAAADEQRELEYRFEEAKLIPRSQHTLRGIDGGARCCAVWGRPPSAGMTAQTAQDLFEGNFAEKRARLSDQLLVDVAVSEGIKPQTIRERARAARERADKTLGAKPDDVDARLARAMANLRLGESQKALDDLQFAIGKESDNDLGRQYRVIALARLGKKQDALTELAKFQNGDAQEPTRLYLAAVAAAELGEGIDKAIGALETAVRKEPKVAGLHYAAARAFALASQVVAGRDQAKGDGLADRALELLKQAVRNEDADFGRMDDDPALDPLRELPAFAKVMRAGHPERRYTAVWSSDARFEAVAVEGLDPPGQVRRGRELVARGYRPVAFSAVRTMLDGPPVTASVWHRPLVSEDVKDRLAERQARGAVALVRLGRAEAVWPLLQHSPDPRLRSFVVNWLSPLGADPKRIAAELARLDSSAPHAMDATVGRIGNPSYIPPAPRSMDAIIFHPETSIRRALILALGTYGLGALSPSEREPLAARLLDLYKNEPDAGIHGAAEWTLRQWNQQQKKLKAIDAGPSKLKDRGQRRWFVNGQGQTFALIDGPVEFRMGSSPTEPDRDSDELPHRRLIPRRFAIATKEVSVAQYQKFVRDYPRFSVEQSYMARRSPDPDGPMNGLSWFASAAYCNWLSNQEGLPREEWCYLPNEQGQYDKGMSIPSDVLKRKGYRLPTEAEWEYACRAGTVTSRYHGLSLDGLGKYARYQANSAEHAWPGASLLPNDLGLFDMLGNVWEWCEDPFQGYEPGKNATIIDGVNKSEYVDLQISRLIRGGAFANLVANVRSADRDGSAPANRYINIGFRPARTYK